MTKATCALPSARLSVDAIKAMLRSDPEAGQLFWIVGPRAGRPAGFINERGYVLVSIRGKNYRASRLIWQLAHGRSPKWRLGYVNGDRLDNRLANLWEIELPREATRSPRTDTGAKPSFFVPYTPSQAIAAAKERIERHAFAEPNSGCHIWMARLDRHGYGRLVVPGFKTVLAHRIAYEFECGEIPNGMVLDHLCRTRCCVNPRHLEVTTNRSNVLRGIAPAAKNARKTHCKRGHELSGDNLYRWRGSSRACRICLRADQARFRSRRKSKAEAAGIPVRRVPTPETEG